jgi:putative PIN family toxin of toxin-antitoxin system
MPISPETIHGHLVKLSQRRSLDAALALFDALGYGYGDELPLPIRNWPAGVQRLVRRKAEPPIYLAQHRDFHIVYTHLTAEITKRWEAEEFEVTISPSLLSELERVLQYQGATKYFKEPQGTVAALLKRLRAVATVVDPLFTLEVVKEDPADNRVLECATAGGASYIITGDAHLLKLKEYQGMVIFKPAEFLALVKLGK